MLHPLPPMYSCVSLMRKEKNPLPLRFSRSLSLSLSLLFGKAVRKGHSKYGDRIVICSRWSRHSLESRCSDGGLNVEHDLILPALVKLISVFSSPYVFLLRSNLQCWTEL